MTLNQINVLNGFVRLDAVSADDLSVVNAARVSFGKRKEVMDEGDEKLIHYLMSNRHTSPFEHNFFRFHVKTSIMVVREWFRHRIGVSYNELSGRYSELPEDFYLPEVDDFRVQVGKPGSYTFEQMDPKDAELARETIRLLQEGAYRTYQALLSMGVAKELARSVLPVSQMTEFYFSCNAKSLMHFISLRNHSQAMHEIRCYAEALEELFSEHMPVTASAFRSYGI